MRSFVYTPDAPVVSTCEGKLRGFILDGIYTFHGVRYAEAQRFHMPTPVQPWEGVKDATNYGYTCPIDTEPMPSGEIYIPHRFWPSNENCQYLNIWTKSIDPAAKKPVMLWLHGGGFANGSSIEQVAYEGDALAEFGDVVVITLNHRLNILGYLDMSSFGAEYKNSVNAGMADIVEALRWIHRNIAAFGGDPENVTVFGQSGGGGKVSALLQIPAAAGLFHRAILLSGIMKGAPKDPAEIAKTHRDTVLGIMEVLGIDDPKALEKVPYSTLMRAYKKASIPLLKQGRFISWGPVADDWYLGDPMVVGFSDYAKTVPTMAGTVISEFSGVSMPGAAEMPREEKMAKIRETYGENAEKLVEMFEKAYPGKDISRLLMLDVGVRQATTDFIARKAEVSSAPAYLYNFALDFDLNGSRPAWHCSDIPFIFHNSHRVPCCNMPGVTQKLEQEVAGAWVAFAHSGDPNHESLASWPAYTEATPATMVFDRKSEARCDYDRAMLAAIAPLARNPFSPEKMIARMIAQAESDGEGSAWLY